MSLSEKISTILAKRFLRDAPAHMIESQEKEFEMLTPLHLQAFAEIESLPIPHKKRAELIKAVGKDIVKRLRKRREIADSIKKAEKEGDYEIEEHKTGLLEL